MLTLYHAPRSRSFRTLWLLEEIGAPYELKVVNIRRGDGSGAADASNPHPLGKVPALVHDGRLVFETSAIALYLTDLFPQAGLGPKIGDNERGAYLSWLAYYSGVFEPSLTAKFLKDPAHLRHVRLGSVRRSARAPEQDALCEFLPPGRDLLEPPTSSLAAACRC